MKTLGLIGGMSWESTLSYYRFINERVNERLGGLHSAELLIYSVDFQPIETMQRAGDWQAAGETLADAASSLERAGADILILCTNTMHKVADAIERRSQLPLLHIAEATAAEIRKQRVRRVGLLGTRFTMEQPFYRERLEAAGFEVLVPNMAGRDEIDRVIFEELCRGDIRSASRQRYLSIIEELIAEGAEGIIFGCTEIGLLIKAEDVPVPAFDTTEIHARAAADAAIG